MAVESARENLYENLIRRTGTDAPETRNSRTCSGVPPQNFQCCPVRAAACGRSARGRNAHDRDRCHCLCTFHWRTSGATAPRPASELARKPARNGINNSGQKPMIVLEANARSSIGRKGASDGGEGRDKVAAAREGTGRAV